MRWELPAGARLSPRGCPRPHTLTRVPPHLQQQEPGRQQPLVAGRRVCDPAARRRSLGCRHRYVVCPPATGRDSRQSSSDLGSTALSLSCLLARCVSWCCVKTLRRCSSLWPRPFLLKFRARGERMLGVSPVAHLRVVAEMASWFVSGIPRSEVRRIATELQETAPPGAFLVRLGAEREGEGGGGFT
jgi:hypothetical protein